MKQLFFQSITRKAALIYLALVTLPVLALSFVLYQNYTQQMTDQAMKDRTTAVNQLSGNLSTTLLSLDNLSRDLIYRSNVLSLLHKQDLNEYPILATKYTEQIVLAVKYSLKYQRLGIEDVCLYSNNETVKEQSYFYQSSRLVGLDCYDRFLASGSYQQLYLLNADEAKDYYTRKGGRYTYSSSRVLYMRQIIEDDNKQLGVLVFEFTPAQIFRSVLSEPGYFVLFQESGRVFGVSPQPGLLEAISLAPESSAVAELGKNAYPFAKIGGFDVVVAISEAVDRSKYDAQAFKLASLIVLMAFFQSLLLYMLTKHIFGKVNRSISAMDAIVRGGYRGHVPVKGTDELAQIASRYNTVLDHVDELVSANVEKETAHKSAQIKALQYQMNPHFIYNTLTVFSGQAEKEGNFELSEAISYFGQLLRYNIQGDGLYATLDQELTNARSLFKVYELKYPSRMTLFIDAEDNALPLQMIKFVIQPLLENSILHGRRGKPDALCVRIQAKIQDTMLSLIVEDDGTGIEPDRLTILREGKELKKEGDRNGSFIGLQNIRDRIRLFYGEAASFEIDSEWGDYTRVTIRIPIQQENIHEFGKEAQICHQNSITF